MIRYFENTETVIRINTMFIEVLKLPYLLNTKCSFWKRKRVPKEAGFVTIHSHFTDTHRAQIISIFSWNCMSKPRLTPLALHGWQGTSSLLASVLCRHNKGPVYCTRAVRPPHSFSACTLLKLTVISRSTWFTRSVCYRSAVASREDLVSNGC